jgi:hypothetical protein
VIKKGNCFARLVIMDEWYWLRWNGGGVPLKKLTQKNSTEMSDWGALGAPLFFVGMFLVAPAFLFLGRW